MTTLTGSEAVARYAAGVRATFSGLAPDLVDDLTDGLEADLTEALLDALLLEEGDSAHAVLATLDDAALAARFGPPAAYAAELATAAGVPVAVVPGPGGEIHDGVAPLVSGAAAPRVRRRRLRTALSTGRDGVARVAARTQHGLRTSPQARAVGAFFVALRPVWWLLRGWGLYFLLLGPSAGGDPFPRQVASWLALAACLVVSVLWGQGSFAQGRVTRGIGLVLSGVVGVAAAAALLAAFNHSHLNASYPDTWSGGFEEGYGSALATGGGNAVLVEGEWARNLFVYGPDGEPVEGARILDQRGRPVTLGGSFGQGGYGSWMEWDTGEHLWAYPENAAVPLGVLDPDVPMDVFPYTYLGDGDLRFDEYDGTVTLRPGAALPEVRWPAATLYPVPGFALGTEAEAAADAQVSETGPGGTETGETGETTDDADTAEQQDETAMQQD